MLAAAHGCKVDKGDLGVGDTKTIIVNLELHRQYSTRKAECWEEALRASQQYGE